MQMTSDGRIAAHLYSRGTGKHRGQMRSTELDLVAHMCNDFQEAGAFCNKAADKAAWLLIASYAGKHRKVIR